MDFGWKARWCVTLEIGGSLRYLHEECVDGPKVHLSVCSDHVVFSNGYSTMVSVKNCSSNAIYTVILVSRISIQSNWSTNSIYKFACCLYAPTINFFFKDGFTTWSSEQSFLPSHIFETQDFLPQNWASSGFYFNSSWSTSELLSGLQMMSPPKKIHHLSKYPFIILSQIWYVHVWIQNHSLKM